MFILNLVVQVFQVFHIGQVFKVFKVDQVFQDVHIDQVDPVWIFFLIPVPKVSLFQIFKMVKVSTGVLC